MLEAMTGFEAQRPSGWLQCGEEDGQLMADSTLWASSPIAAARHEFKNQTPINSKEPVMETREHPHREAWNKGKLVGQKAPLKPKDIWAIRIHLQNAHAVRDLAMFINPAIK